MRLFAYGLRCPSNFLAAWIASTLYSISDVKPTEGETSWTRTTVVGWRTVKSHTGVGTIVTRRTPEAPKPMPQRIRHVPEKAGVGIGIAPSLSVSGSIDGG